MQRLREVPGDINRRHAEPGSAESPSNTEAFEHRFRAIDWARKADPDVAAVRSIDRCIDPDHVALRIKQRTTAVSGIDGRVGLDHPFHDLVVLSLYIARERAH